MGHSPLLMADRVNSVSQKVFDEWEQVKMAGNHPKMIPDPPQNRAR